MPGISVTPLYKDIAQLAQEHRLRRADLIVTGMTASSLNTVPHGLGVTPVMVIPTAYSNDGAAALTGPTLDGSNGTYGGGSAKTGLAGYDATNVYLVCPSGTVAAKLMILF